jgi:hypothetical protein
MASAARHGMAEPAAFERYQRAFTAHIRDPRGARRPAGAEARRMNIYNELLFNNVEGFLLSCFPVARRALGKRAWTRLARAFFARHRCHSPYFRQIPEEFLTWLQAEDEVRAATPDWLVELLHYEWIELALSVSNLDEDADRGDPQGDLLDGRPAVNPVSATLAYRYPVHRISARFKPTPEQQTPACFLVFRDAGFQVRFTLTNATTARLVELLRPGTHTGRSALLELAVELHHPDPPALLAFGAEVLADLRAQGMIVGTRPVPSPPAPLP